MHLAQSFRLNLLRRLLQPPILRMILASTGPESSVTTAKMIDAAIKGAVTRGQGALF